MRTGISFETIELSLTNFCQLSCQGCPSFSLDSPRKQELNIDRLIEKISPFEVERFLLCGNSGEPLEHSEIKKLIIELGRKFPKTKIHIATNGEMITRIFSKDDLNSFPSTLYFEVALDGSTQTIHEITRKNGNHSLVLETIAFLSQSEVSYDVVFSRHELNQHDAKKTNDLIENLTGKHLLFRDTTIVNEAIKPPSQMSTTGDVSILYQADRSLKNHKVTPFKKYLYVDTNGDCYPCVSFTKKKTTQSPPNLYNDESWASFIKHYFDFSPRFCDEYQKNGDRRQCVLNCEVYRTFRYDTAKSLGLNL